MSEFREKVIQSFKSLQDEICEFLVAETGQKFREDEWEFERGSGGGITRIFEGEVIEKGGVNFSAIEGELSEKLIQKIGNGSEISIFATGVSSVLHPVNPFVPTIHLNVRYLERGNRKWFGGGIDLTPYYVDPEDVSHYHQQLKNVCDQFDPEYYPRFKQQCDNYFYLKHRNEHRGVGGIFFDYLDENLEDNFEFVLSIGRVFKTVFLPFLKRYKDQPYSESQKEFQLYRRGRYVEFNLIYDKGTLFGLETGGRIESILISLPPETKWKYDWSPSDNSMEAKLSDLLKPRDWATF